MKDKILAAGTNYGITIEDAAGDDPGFRLWASSEISDDDMMAQVGDLYTSFTGRGFGIHNITIPQVVCVGR